MGVWRRNALTTFDLLSGFNWEDAIGEGNTYQRVHIRWGFQFDCPLTNDISVLATDLVYFGLVTTVGNGTEIPPGARLDAWPDAAPPLERWIYWETLAPVLEVVDEAANLMVWRGAASTEVTSTKGQVANTGVPAGDTLNLFTSWDANFDWVGTTGGNVMLWHTLSILRKNAL